MRFNVAKILNLPLLMKFRTEILIPHSGLELGLDDRTVLLGSCFSDNIGTRLADAGFNVLRNPFGTLYNPASIASAVRRLDSGRPFTEADCVKMGAGSELICSFEHHTSFARESAQEFLDNANARLQESRDFWKSCGKVVVTLGSAFVWKALERGGAVVSNCLKRPDREFAREMLSVQECASLLQDIIASHPDKEFIFTVSPIRHLSDGAHSNTLSKSTLHLAVDSAMAGARNAAYFPAYELMMDELRDYRFWAKDMVHPSELAVDYIWEQFIAAHVPKKDLAGLRANEKSSLRARHKPMK